ncbi:hypothetical protein C0989_004914 [Termitomyces sp. Mn162]|nr:hypothetical protein C0989_004914 [Termitomyces sp. Mn162]
MYSGGFSTASPNPAYLPPAHCYAYLVPTAAPAPPKHPDNYFPPQLPFPTQTPPSPRQQWVEAYVQQCNEVLYSLCLSPAEFTRCTHTLLINLGYPNIPTTLKVWVDWLLNFHEHHLQGNLPKTMQGTLGIDANLQNELCVLDPSCSFYVQHEELIGIQSEAPPLIPCQQEELNMVSNILGGLNPTGGLFDQPATHTLALSTHPQANSVPSAFHTWDQPAIPKPHTQWLLPCIDNNNQTLSYIDKLGNPTDKVALHNSPPQDRPPHFDLCTPHVNTHPPRQNVPVPLRQPMGPGAP